MDTSLSDQTKALVKDLLKDAKPNEIKRLNHGHSFLLFNTGDEGIHTGRPRFFVACVSCYEVLHHNTTGPEIRVDDHLVQVTRADNLAEDT